MKIQVICVAYKRALPLELLIDSFLCQTNPDWELHIIHDGTPPRDVLDVIANKKDIRITFEHTETQNGKWGHPNRRYALESIKCSPFDFILITNDDNYYVPRFIGQFIEAIKTDTGMVYCDAIHSYTDYGIHNTQIKEGWIDIGSFIVRADVAKSVGFIHDHISADGAYAEECLYKCKSMGLFAKQIQKYLFIHN